MSALLEALNRHDDHALAISDVDGDHGWGAIRSSAAAAAGRLAGDAALRSVGPEDDAGPRIGLLVSPGHRWLATLIAIWRAGMVAVPLSPRYPDRELADLLDDAGAAARVVTVRATAALVPFLPRPLWGGCCCSWARRSCSLRRRR